MVHVQEKHFAFKLAKLRSGNDIDIFISKQY